MRLYAVALITWAATITAFSEPNVANLSDEKAVDYTELRDLPEKQITGFHVTGIEARSSGRTNTGDHPDVGSSGTADEKGWNGVSAGDSSTSEVIYATPLAETIDEYPFKEQSREAVSEDILLVENAGSFGQRVRQDRPNGRTAPGNTRNTVRNTIGDSRKDDEYASTRKSFSSTASPLEDGRPYVSVTSEPYVLALKKESDLADDPPAFSDPEVVKSKASNREEIFNVETVKEPSAPAEDNVASILSENDVVPEDLQTRVRSSRAYNGTEAEASTEKPEESVEKSVVQVSSSTSVEISSSVQPVKFSGPIIVADLVDRATPEMTVDYLDDGDAAVLKSVENAEITPGSYVESSRPKAPVLSKGIETSSIMLNPLQVGIALVNAHETGSMVDSEQSAATDTKDYLQDYPQDDLQRLSTGDKKFIENDVENRSRVDYKDESFQREGEKSSVEAVTQKVPDNSVEIQKSVEIYHTAPVHEIHYPPVYIQQTSNLGVIETNNIGRPSQPYGQDEQSESRSNYEVYRGNEQSVDRSVIKTHTSDQKLSRNQYNALEDDDLAKPTASAFIGDEYAPNAVHEQAPVETTVELQPYKYNDVPPVLLLPNQFDDTSYDQSHVRHNFNDNGDALSPHSAKVLTYPGTARQESASETYRPDHQQQQLSQQPTIDHQFRRPEAPQLLLKIIPAGSSSNEGFMVPLPRPYPPIERIVEKTIHVPHPIEIEKVIEKKVPFPVERVVEKRVQVPVPVAVPHQLYHVHQVQPMVEKQVRLPQVYPVHVERLIEKRLPYVIQRLVVQPTASYPLQLRLSPTEKPATIAARLPPSATVPRPYRTDAERPTDSDKLNDIAVKYRQKLVSSSNPRGGDSAVFESQSETNASKLYGIPPYGRPLTYDYNIDVGKGYVPFTDVKLMILPRKYNSHHVVLRPQAVASSYTTLPFRQHIVYNLVERNKASKDEEYVGPAPPRKISQNKTPTSVAQPSATVAALRRSRQPETQYPGSFRQSKMEYGFKPPMVPSVQYDELTATAVEN